MIGATIPMNPHRRGFKSWPLFETQVLVWWFDDGISQAAGGQPG
jgi:hypothetical protein